MPTPHYVVNHLPGPGWIAGTHFLQQPNVMDHANYYYDLYREGKVLMGGPIPALDGGMIIMTPGVPEEEVNTIAAADPAVMSGLLKYDVKTWLVVFGPGRDD